MKLTVIGAGLPRTGTSSLKESLEILYPEGSCYHMFTFLYNGTSKDADHWLNAINGKIRKEDWITFFNEKKSCCAVDYPTSFFYKELLKAYPGAKVILTVRDPKAWHESCYSTIFVNHEDISIPWIYYFTGLAKRYGVAVKVREQVIPGFEMSMKDASQCGPEASKAYFEKWIEEVKRYVPEEQLLIFDVREGWDPLCKFLDKPIPNISFPRTNDRASIKERIKLFRIWGWSISFGIIAMIGGFIYYTFSL